MSFFGLGFDGLVQATALAMLHPALPVHLGVYLLPLRHPVLVARQLADFAQLAPGRLVLRVGVGGEDRHEISVCGVDPATRGRRMNECLAVVRQLLDGGAVSFHGAFFDLDEVVIAPAPAVPIPVIVGGRSDEAVRRAGRLGDGWLGIWNSPERFAAATALAAEEAARTARTCPPSRHAMQVWCGLADSRQALTRAAAQGRYPHLAAALAAAVPRRHDDIFRSGIERLIETARLRLRQRAQIERMAPPSTGIIAPVI